MVALYTARICEFFVECLGSGMWSGSFSVFSSFSARFRTAVLQRAFSCILFFQFFKAYVSSCSFRTQTTNNSLSTMSSPVTPAPPVNTPASQPSQPVSLPDNNYLARAISRALAESLPLLLSFPRDSSGGNTTMPATFVPIS